MDGDRVAAKGIQKQYVEILGVTVVQFSLERYALISEHSSYICLAFTQERKIIPDPGCQVDDNRVDLIQPVHITGSGIRHQRPHTETQQANPHVLSLPVFGMIENRQPHARLWDIVGCRDIGPFESKEE